MQRTSGQIRNGEEEDFADIQEITDTDYQDVNFTSSNRIEGRDNKTNSPTQSLLSNMPVKELTIGTLGI
jgi:hypothetical protein